MKEKQRNREIEKQKQKNQKNRTEKEEKRKIEKRTESRIVARTTDSSPEEYLHLQHILHIQLSSSRQRLEGLLVLKD